MRNECYMDTVYRCAARGVPRNHGGMRGYEGCDYYEERDQSEEKGKLCKYAVYAGSDTTCHNEEAIKKSRTE